ncbi:hypothetical protein M427DRAFT_57062 [Gonapodya prolifera JEL478]|uniref:Serine hydrolase domain-containing protein n=1 Tax=Gonapodya prolifera (strain JEL478) TaxID=1344416 RepID=A0A139AEQ4_GONPJ|nr:hypothetical protein M427DRAFT_57062 [Gonapodya prolifera JEL478]|eukprot:KXS14915.1 hypothetical protein M427DRAFT_57062 [Gonapodya prolifera JEL478]
MPAPPRTPTPSKPQRILAFHGYLQSGQILRNKVGAITKTVKSNAEFVFLTAHHPASKDIFGPVSPPTPPPGGSTSFSDSTPPADVDEQLSSLPSEPYLFGWYDIPQPTPLSTDPDVVSRVLSTYRDSLRTISSIFLPRRHESAVDTRALPLSGVVTLEYPVADDDLPRLGPFDGVLGFSMGCAMAAMSLFEANRKNDSTTLKLPRYGIFFCGTSRGVDLILRNELLESGYRSGGQDENPDISSRFSQMREQMKSIKTLHFIGKKDAVVPNELSIRFADLFTDPEIIYFDGGHVVPGDAPTRKKVLEFIRAQNS